MKYCPECGASMKDWQNTCPQCGCKVTAPSKEEVPEESAGEASSAAVKPTEAYDKKSVISLSIGVATCFLASLAYSLAVLMKNYSNDFLAVLIGLIAFLAPVAGVVLGALSLKRKEGLIGMILSIFSLCIGFIVFLVIAGIIKYPY